MLTYILYTADQISSYSAVSFPSLPFLFPSSFFFFLERNTYCSVAEDTSATTGDMAARSARSASASPRVQRSHKNHAAELTSSMPSHVVDHFSSSDQRHRNTARYCWFSNLSTD